MADLRGDREGSANVTELSCSSGGNGRSETATPHQLMVSGSFKGDGKGPRSQIPIRSSLDADKFINLLHGSDPVKVELNRLENEVRDKDRELGEAQAEMKALRYSERLREKAVKDYMN